MSKISLTDYDAQVEQLTRKIIAEVRPFPDTSASARAERVKRAEKDLIFFRKTYLPHYFGYPFSKKHLYVDTLTNIENQIVKLEAFRGFGKTVFFQTWLLNQLLYKKTKFSTWTSFTQEKAALHLAVPRTELKVNERIACDFNVKIGSTDESTEFLTNASQMVKAYGRKIDPRGDRFLQYRPDTAIIDDFESDKHIRNQSITAEGINFIYSQLIPAMRPSWRMFYLGTPLARKCVLTELRKNPAIMDVRIPILEDNKSVWPQPFPIKKIKDIIRLVGRSVFNREYLLQITDENDPFQEADFKFYGENAEVLDFEKWKIVGFFDPSIGEEMHHHYKAFVTVGQAPGDNKIYVLDVWMRKCSIEQAIGYIFNSYLKYKHQTIGIEINCMPLLRTEMRHWEEKLRVFLPVRQIRQTRNKIGRIVSTLESPTQRGDILYARDQYETVIWQLLELMNPTVEDDGADALEGAVSMIQNENLGRIDKVIIL